jgi:hypothetical protein
MDLARLEREILTLHNGLSLRPTVETAMKIGDLLMSAKEQVEHGKWRTWVRRVGIAPRTAQVYIQVAKAHDSAPDGRISLNAFLSMIRSVKRAVRAEERREAREAAIAAAPPAEERFRVECSDCRKFRWPFGIDLIATDPVWTDPKAYAWLGKMAQKHLRDGGLLLVQCGSSDVLELGNLITESGLLYVWCLALVYDTDFPMKAYPIGISWRPVLMFSKGKWKTKGLRAVTDTITSSNAHFVKRFHVWQQPVKPFAHWLGAFTRPGELVCDPFCGTGTIGVVAYASYKLGEAMVQLPEKMRAMAEAAVEANRKFADVSSAMAIVIAKYDVEKLMSRKRVGDATAGSAAYLAQNTARLNKSLEAQDSFGQNISNYIEGFMTRITTWFSENFTEPLFKFLNEWFGFVKDQANKDDPNDTFEDWLGSISGTGGPPRPKPAPKPAGGGFGAGLGAGVFGGIGRGFAAGLGLGF